MHQYPIRGTAIASHTRFSSNIDTTINHSPFRFQLNSNKLEQNSNFITWRTQTQGNVHSVIARTINVLILKERQVIMFTTNDEYIAELSINLPSIYGM